MVAALRLLRPFNAVLSLAAVALGAVLAAGRDAFDAPLPLALAVVSAALIGSASNALNDVVDLKIDRVNRPDRPIPSGAISVRAARGLWVGLSALGVATGAAVSPALGAIALVSGLLLWVYNVRLKGTPGPGNVVASAVIAAALLYGALAVGEVSSAVWQGVALTFALVLGREIVKDVEDAVGDAAHGARTLAVALGERRAAALALGILALTLAALPLPAALGLGRSFALAALPCAACLLAAAWALGVGLGLPEAALRARAGVARAWLKGAMVAGIAALALARLA